MKQNIKNPGVSFAMGIIISTILLGIGMTIFESVSQVAQQGYDLEAKSKLFYEHEKGFEEALYYHNKNGGQGTSHTETGTETNGKKVDWKIIGRKTGVLTGILKESETIEIPFYYTNSGGETQVSDNFSLSFSRFKFENDGSVSTNEIIPDIGSASNDFNFPSSTKNNVIISWAVTRTLNNTQIQTFVPYSNLPNGQLCSNSFIAWNPDFTDRNGSSFFCEAALKSNLISETGAIINSSQQIIGKILPGEEETTLSSFWNNPSATNRKLSFRPLTLFYNQNDPTKTQKIRGIPWRLTVSDTNTQIPTPTFTIETTASVNNGKFAKTQTVTLKEKTSISALDSFVAE